MVAHLLFAGVLAGAVAVRVVSLRGYPSMLWGGDSHGYLDAAVKFRPHVGRPSGYSVFLWGLGPFESLAVVAVVQAALGVAAGVLVYAVVWRAARAAWPRWVWVPGLIAAPASVPVLYDGNLIQAERMLLADSLFTFLLVAAVAVVLWSPQLRWWTAALAGLLTSFAALTRLAGLPFIGLILVVLLLRWSGWRRTTASVVLAGVAFAGPFFAYMAWFQEHYGTFAVSKAGSVWLYGRTAAFADCAKIQPPPELRVMCPEPPADRRVAPAFDTLWGPDSPFQDVPGGIYGEEGNAKAGEFANLAIKKQFGDYLDVVLKDTLRAFDTGREPYPTPWTAENLRFPEGETWSDDQELLTARYGGGRMRVVEPQAEWTRKYQERWYTPGPALAVLLGTGLVGVLIRVRRWGGAGLLPWCVGTALIVIPAASADFDYRYVPPAIPFACLAAALALVPGRREVQAAESASVPDEESAAPAEGATEATDGADEEFAAPADGTPEATEGADEATEGASEARADEAEEPDVTDGPQEPDAETDEAPALDGTSKDS
ncbi:hypothetical protein [Spirillospora albida]|uniref:hypothetical protein n=1 Tax=Spirillospora albida TaxID=58123 RepID=UPI00068DE071|nr:hypothetical protein [Spirillospora albida]